MSTSATFAASGVLAKYLINAQIVNLGGVVVLVCVLSLAVRWHVEDVALYNVVGWPRQRLLVKWRAADALVCSKRVVLVCF